MKLKCVTKVLLKNLKSLLSTVPNRPAHPVLANVFLRANKGEQALYLIGFDLCVGKTIRMNAEVLEEGEIAVPPSLLTSILSKIADTDVFIDCTGVKLVVTSSGSDYAIQGMPPDDYPEIPTTKEANGFTISGDAILKAINSVFFAASADETKQVLTGINFRIDNNLLTLAATDGHRLSVYSIPSDNVDMLGDSLELNITISRNALKEIVKSIKAFPNPKVAFHYDNSHQLVVAIENHHIYSRLREEDYPAYYTLLPSDFEANVIVDRTAFLKATERVAVIADKKNNIFKCTFDSENQELIIYSEALDVGCAKESVPIKCTGNLPEAIAFNTKYLMDVLKAYAPVEEVVLNINKATNPVIVKPLGVDAKYLLMPVQLRN